jgi:hypothetical protein
MTRRQEPELQTAEQIIAKHGPLALMVAAADLARARGHLTVEFWRGGLAAEWTLIINGTAETRDGVPPWHATVLYCSIPIVLFNAASGLQVPDMIIDGLDAEGAALAAIERATHPGGGRRLTR